MRRATLHAGFAFGHPGVRRAAAMHPCIASAKLFDRGRNGIAPTKAGEDLLPVAEEMESVMARFNSAADRLEHEASGLVRITSPPDVAEVVLVPLLGELFTRHRKLRLELIPGEALLDLTRREADLALRYGLVPLKMGSALRRVAEGWPSDELFLVTHRALREVPRVEAVWQLLVERVGGRPS